MGEEKHGLGAFDSSLFSKHERKGKERYFARHLVPLQWDPSHLEAEGSWGYLEFVVD